ncbi:hypothetical protein ACJW30_09G147100 [Castanea mollissima]
MEHVISMEEFHSRKVETKEAGESSRDNDQPVIVAGDTHKLTTTIQERGSTSSKEEKFKKLLDAQAKVQLGTTPKIGQVLMLRGHKHYRKYCEPRVISLGPIHHGKPAYQLIEEYKLMLANKFIGKSGRTDEELYGIIEKNIKELRGYYDEKVTQKYSDEDLAWMLFVDGCATLHFIDSIVNDTIKDVKIKNDQVAFVQQDLFLLENQLPYKLLDYLMKNIKEEENSKKEENLRKSIQNFINMQSMLAEGTESSNAQKASHLLDLLRKRLLGTTGKEELSTKEDKSGEKLPSTTVNTVPNKKDTKPTYDENAIHLLDLLRKRLLASINKKCPQSSKHEENFEYVGHSLRNVQQLKAAGIHLKSSSNSDFKNITFTEKWKFYGGILYLPSITVDELTGPKFFNLIAYEMSPDFENDYGVTSYISFLDSLIHEAKDVMHLKQAGIVRNLIGSDEKVAQVFNEIGTDLVPNPIIYRGVRVGLQNYYHNKKVMIWISETLYTRLNNPLSFPVLAFGGAVLALTFSLVQMIYAILSYEYQRRH